MNSEKSDGIPERKIVVKETKDIDLETTHSTGNSDLQERIEKLEKEPPLIRPDNELNEEVREIVDYLCQALKIL